MASLRRSNLTGYADDIPMAATLDTEKVVNLLSNTHKIYQIKVPSETDNLELVREVVAKVAAKEGFGKDEVSRIELAVDEACANVIKHAYGNDTKKYIDILLEKEDDKLVVVVTDHGRGFNPNAIKQPNMEEYLKKFSKGGLGIFLMETLMDQVEFDIKPGVKNQVRMIKYLNKEKSNHQ